VLEAAFELAGIKTGFSRALNSRWPLAAEDDTRRLIAGVEGPWSAPLLQSLVVTGLRLTAGFTLAVLIGAALGLVMWRFTFANAFFGSLCLGLQALPSVCWVPLAIIVFGLREQSVLFVLVAGSCFAIAISLRDGLGTIPPIYQRAGAMLGAGGWRMYRYVLLPASMPAMSTSLRQGFAFAWRSLMGAELVFTAARNRGLGFLLDTSRRSQDVAQVVAVMLLMIGIAMLIDRLVFAPLETRVRTRFGLVTA
jgi:NitT/TauT family transport system permease protein